MKIFVTGASGFVGSAVTASLIKNGHTVYGMSRTADGISRIRLLGAIGVQCDIRDVTPAHLSGCTILIHAAAFVGQWGSYQMFFDTNVTGTLRLIATAKEAAIIKLIYISTESVLVNGQNLLNVTEDHPYPNTPFHYSKTKQLAEKAVRAANIPGVFETVCLRPRMIWGSGDSIMLPLLKSAVLQKKFMWIDNGCYRISTTHIANLVYAIELAIEKAPGGSVYFITDNETSTIKNFFTRLLDTQNIVLHNKSAPKWIIRPVAFVIEKCWYLFKIKSRPPITRLGAVTFSSHCTLNISKAEKELGYAPVISVEAGLKQLVAKKPF